MAGGVACGSAAAEAAFAACLALRAACLALRAACLALRAASFFSFAVGCAAATTVLSLNAAETFKRPWP